MVTLSQLDILVILLFFAGVMGIGYWASKKRVEGKEGFILSGRNVGLVMFVLTGVSTWYGGILGVGEFTFNYGLLSWFTQGLPYYIFAIVFALFFAKKIRGASLLTIPAKIEEVYGRNVAIPVAVLVFFLVSPAPYLLMIGNLLSLIFDIPIVYSLGIGLLLTIFYLIKGGYKADLYTDAFEFFVMFIGFIAIVLTAYFSLGGSEYLASNLPEEHLTFTGGASPMYVIVWFLIALWTFADPGFHQRCYSAKSGDVAKWGIIISVGFWALFDFLTTTSGLYARAVNPDLANPVNAFPDLAERILPGGLKGLFYAGMFATILSTLNSFLFLSGVTFGNDILEKILPPKKDNVNIYSQVGIVVSSIIAFIMAYQFESVVELWYMVGSICIPAIILPVLSSYYENIIIDKKLILMEIIASLLASHGWYQLRNFGMLSESLNVIEPMIVGLVVSLVIHVVGVILKSRLK